MSAKKNIQWNLCENCHSVFFFKDRTLHMGICNGSNEYAHPYIQGKQITSTLTYFIEKDLKLASHINVNNIILLSQSALQLLGVPIGSPVMVKVEDQIVVKNVWFSTSKPPLSISLTKTACELLSFQSGQVISLSPVADIYPASFIEIQFLNLDMTKKVSDDILPYLSQKFVNNVFCINNVAQITSLGKKIPFKIMELKTNENLKATNEVNCYIIKENTKWSIIGIKEDEPVKLSRKIGGLNEEIQVLKDYLSLMLAPEIYPDIDISKGILIFGPEGCGKTLLVDHVLSLLDVKTVTIEVSQILSKYFGDTEKQLKKQLEKAFAEQPCIILCNDIDNLFSNQTTNQNRRIVTTLSNFMDLIYAKRQKIVVIGTCTSISLIHSSLRRSGRFDKEIELSVPTPQKRLDILKSILSDLRHELSDADISQIANSTHGFVGADLASLVTQAFMHSFRSNQNEPTVKLSNMRYSLSKVKPSAMKEVLIEVPCVKWSDIAGQEELKLKLRQAIEWPLTNSGVFERLGITPPKGVLMYGPPGCSKTMIAKALATESQLNFITVKGSELLSKWVGESEKAIHEVFRKAKQMAPSIVFFDELDALGGERSTHSSSGVNERILAQLLVELDGVEPLGNVTFVGATNRPDKMDKALLRPGRLDRVIYVPLPDLDTRQKLFELQLNKIPSSKIDITSLAERTEGYSGAEIVSICHEAALKSLEENIDASLVEPQHFEAALHLVKPQTSAQLLNIYNNFKIK